MVISGDRKLVIYEEAACENVGQLRPLSNNCASASCPGCVSQVGVGPRRRIGGGEQGVSEGGHRLSCFGKRTSGSWTSGGSNVAT